MGKIKKTTESEKVTESWAELTTGVVDAAGGAFSALFTQQLPELSNIEITDDEEQYVTIFTGQQQEDDGFRHKYVMWGSDNLLPALMSERIEQDETMTSSLNTLKNICYGGGVSFCIDENDPERLQERKMALREAKDWFECNDVSVLTLQQAKNLKTFGMDLTVIILSADGTEITDIYSRDVEEVRLHPHLTADTEYNGELLRKGTIPFAYYGKFNSQRAGSIKDVEVIRLLDERNPLRDLKVKMGKVRNPYTGSKLDVRCRKYGILRRLPNIGKRFYPVPPYRSALSGNWYEIKHLIETSLIAKIKNTAQIRYVVQVHPEYWRKLVEEEGKPVGMVTPEARAIIKKKKQEITDYLFGVNNNNKSIIATQYREPGSGEVSDMIKISVVDTKTQGGDWAEDISESCNMLCYGAGVHPSLAGAVPGKATSLSSGTDKRELHTIAQAADISTRDVMMMAYRVVLGYMGWADKGVMAHIPFLQLTTLDEHKSAKEVKVNKDAQDV